MVLKDWNHRAFRIEVLQLRHVQETGAVYINTNYLDRSDLPISARIALHGIVTSIILFLLTILAAAAFNKWGNPNLQRLFVLTQMLLSGIGLIAMSIEVYSIIRYPYLSLAINIDPPFEVTNRWIWKLLGAVFWMIAATCLLFLILVPFDPELGVLDLLSSLYLFLESSLVGFVLIMYKPDRHPTLATYFYVTNIVGFVVFPFYFPAILIGSIRCRRFLKKIGFNQSNP